MNLRICYSVSFAFILNFFHHFQLCMKQMELKATMYYKTLISMYTFAHTFRSYFFTRDRSQENRGKHCHFRRELIQLKKNRFQIRIPEVREPINELINNFQLFGYSFEFLPLYYRIRC